MKIHILDSFIWPVIRGEFVITNCDKKMVFDAEVFGWSREDFCIECLTRTLTRPVFGKTYLLAEFESGEESKEYYQRSGRDPILGPKPRYPNPIAVTISPPARIGVESMV